MLVLSRKPNEEVLIGENVCIKVVAVSGNKVRLGISAPSHVRIQRAELDFLGRMTNRLPEDSWPELGDLEVVDLEVLPA
jgi:carbon storage regulator